MNRKRIYRTITNLIIAFAFTLIFTGIENAGAGETNYFTNGVRDMMSHAEKVGLIIEEDLSLTIWEAESIVARMDGALKREESNKK